MLINKLSTRHKMKVCIEKTPDNQFLVSKEDQPAEAQGGMPGEMMKPEMGGSNKQPAKSLQDALMLAGRMLSEESQSGMSPFDEGVRETMPRRGGMMG
jgi:hypothetical protein